MRRRWQLWNRSLCLVASVSLGLLPVAASAQDAVDGPIEAVERVIRRAVAPGAVPEPTKPDEKPADKPADKKEEEAPITATRDPINPKLVMLHLQDGTTIAGEMTINEITVATEFGDLKVPLNKIRSIAPGLSSSPELSGKVNGLIEALGSDDYKAREQAHKDLAAMGLKVHGILQGYRNDENTERKRHIGEILKEMDELAGQQDDDDPGTKERPLIAKDTVVTDDFTIVGKISPAEFVVSSKYGPLNVALADLRRAERPRSVKEAIRKTVQVPGDSLVQRGFKNSGIKVEAGDKVSIKADGSIVMSPWGSDQNSGPDGGANFGWYIPNQIYGGALVAKIGDKGQVFKVGSKATFVAKASGTLQFGIAMQQQYSQQGYSYPGNYNAKITIEGQ
jgi:hypothetical protein